MMQVIGSTSNRMLSRALVTGVAGKSRKVRQAKASTIEATQPIRSAWVRSDSMRILAMSSKGPPLDVFRSQRVLSLLAYLSRIAYSGLLMVHRLAFLHGPAKTHRLQGVFAGTYCRAVGGTPSRRWESRESTEPFRFRLRVVFVFRALRGTTRW